MTSLNRNYGYVKVIGGKVWYTVIGIKENLPLVTIHGGPGATHYRLKPLEELADNREVVFYDQLGCGKSQRPKDESLWKVNRFASELEMVIRHLGMKRYHIFGHSWGAAVACSFALKKPRGLVSLVLSDPYLSTKIWENDAKKLVRSLPNGMEEAIAIYEKHGMNKKEFARASKEFHDRFVYQSRSMPKEFWQVDRLARKERNSKIYTYMWGPEEFWAAGTLRNLDLTKRLREIKVPVLLLCGHYDEATPQTTSHFGNLFPNATMKIFKKSAHYPFWNEKKAYLKTIKGFLNSVEG